MQNLLTEPSRNIPSSIQREVRQRCGFGCVICGVPIYDYEHMNEWALVKEHVAEDITLLCPQHHRERTSGRLPIEIVKEYNKNPYNSRKGQSSSMPLFYQGDSCEFLIGGNNFIMDSHGESPTQMIPIMVDGIPLFSFILDDGHLLLDANIFDENNELVFVIRKNQLLYSTELWDIQFVGKTLTIREKMRKILLNIIFDTPNKVIIDKARLLCNGVELLIKKDQLLVNNQTSIFERCTFENCQGGIVIGSEPQISMSVGIRMSGINRYASKCRESMKLSSEILQ